MAFKETPHLKNKTLKPVSYHLPWWQHNSHVSSIDLFRWNPTGFERFELTPTKIIGQANPYTIVGTRAWVSSAEKTETMLIHVIITQACNLAPVLPTGCVIICSKAHGNLSWNFTSFAALQRLNNIYFSFRLVLTALINLHLYSYSICLWTLQPLP